MGAKIYAVPRTPAQIASDPVGIIMGAHIRGGTVRGTTIQASAELGLGFDENGDRINNNIRRSIVWHTDARISSYVDGMGGTAGLEIHAARINFTGMPRDGIMINGQPFQTAAVWG